MTLEDNSQPKWRVTKVQWFMSMLFSVVGLLILVGCNAPTTLTNSHSEPLSVSSGGDELGVVVDENMKVLHVEPGWAADKAGVQVGDVLDSVEGVSLLKERGKAKDLIHAPKKDKKLHLKLKRANQDVTLEITSFPPPSGENLPTVTPVPTPEDYF